MATLERFRRMIADSGGGGDPLCLFRLGGVLKVKSGNVSDWNAQPFFPNLDFFLFFPPPFLGVSECSVADLFEKKKRPNCCLDVACAIRKKPAGRARPVDLGRHPRIREPLWLAERHSFSSVDAEVIPLPRPLLFGWQCGTRHARLPILERKEMA